MSIITILSILELINKVIKTGGELVPVALRAYNALRAESGMTDDELIAAAESLNAADKTKLENLIASLPNP